MFELSSNTIKALGASSIFPVIEFASLFTVVIATYLLLHKVVGHLKPSTKMLVSMFFGTLAYSIGKIAVIALLVTPTF